MTDTEIDILDELYFVTSFPELASQLAMPENVLSENLSNLIKQSFVKCFFPDPDTEIEFEESGFGAHFREYFYLATKAGLLAHNSR